MLEKRNQNKIKYFISASIFLIISLEAFFLEPLLSFADTSATAAPSISQQRQQKIQELAQLNQQINDLKTQIQSKLKLGASLKNEISLYNTEISATQLQINATNTNIDNTDLEIQDIQAQIAAKNDQIKSDRQILAQLLVSINQYDQSSAIQIGLGTKSFSDFLNQIQYTDSLQGKVYDLVQQIKDLKQKLESNEQDLQTSLQQLKTLQDQLSQTQKALTNQRASKASLLVQTKGQESSYQKLLASTQNEEQKVNNEIYQLDLQAQGKKGFTAMPTVHGIIAWPMNGVITQGYGNTGFTQLGYNFHNGIDIAAAPGTEITAAADGVVLATGTGQAAYGNWVAIKHNIVSIPHPIITLYAHMMSFSVSAGQTVKQGETIGLEGNTGNTTRLLYGPDRGYHLHFGVFDAENFGINQGAYQSIYGSYQVPYGYTYNPLDFL